MKTKTVALLLALCITSALTYAAQAVGGWVRYTSAEGRYNVLLPSQPKLSQQQANAASGEPFTQYLASSQDSDGLFMVGHFTYTASMVFSLDKARDGMVNAVNGTLVSDRPVTLAGHAGREVKITARLPNGQETMTHARFYDVNGRVYILQHMFLRRSESPAMAGKSARFFDSFKVTTAHSTH